MPKSISSLVAEDGDDDEMPGLEEIWIPPADQEDILEQIAIWNACQAAARQTSTDFECDKGDSAATVPTPGWDHAGSSGAGAKHEVSPLSTQSLENFNFNFDFPKMDNSPASDCGSIRVLGIETEDSLAVESNDSSPTGIVEPEPQRVFHLFSKLPEAIRLTIWNLNNPGGRLVEIVEWKRNCQFYGIGQRVANLQVCHESRVEALKTYPLSFSVDFKDPLIPFCFEKDTLLLGRRLLDEENHIYFRKNCDRGDLARVQRLVVDTALRWTTASEDVKLAEKNSGSGLQLMHRDRGTGFGGLSRIIFSGLKEYTALYNEDTDPGPEWAKLKWYPSIPIFPYQRINNTPWESQYQTLKELWPHIEFGGDPDSWYEVTRAWTDHARHGGISESKKRDPAIKRWEMPRIASLALDRELVEQFYESDVAPWPFLLVDQAIGDIFE